MKKFQNGYYTGSMWLLLYISNDKCDGCISVNCMYANLFYTFGMLENILNLFLYLLIIELLLIFRFFLSLSIRSIRIRIFYQIGYYDCAWELENCFQTKFLLLKYIVWSDDQNITSWKIHDQKLFPLSFSLLIARLCFVSHHNTFLYAYIYAQTLTKILIRHKIVYYTIRKIERHKAYNNSNNARAKKEETNMDTVVFVAFNSQPIFFFANQNSWIFFSYFFSLMLSFHPSITEFYIWMHE